MFFLTEYADELLLALCAIITILLLVTLHRIKRITKLIQEITGNLRKEEPDLNAYKSADILTEEEPTKLSEEEYAALFSEKTENKEQPRSSSAQQEELINAVLEEVFP